MKLYAVGLEPAAINALKEQEYEIVSYTHLPETGPTNGAWIVTSDIVPVSELSALRLRFPDSILVYWYVTPSVAGWQAVHALCEQWQIHFLRPGIGISAMLAYFKAWFHASIHPSPPVIGVFGTTPGIGCTRVAATAAQAIARQGHKVILLGLNLFCPGWEGDATVSLDRWRQRLIGRMLQPDDWLQLVRTQGFFYLPGNFDLLSALDYEEEDITHLLQAACQAADVVVADCGAIPESAAWFCGMQAAGLRIVVTHPQQTRSLQTLIQLAKTLEVPAEHLFLCGNRLRGEDMPLKQLAAVTGTHPWFGFPDKGWAPDFSLPLSKREQEAFDEALAPFLTAFGMDVPVKKKGWL